MFDIVAIGETLIDFTPDGSNNLGMPLYSQNPGGAPANVLAMSSMLGCNTAFIGKVGRDGFGSFIRQYLLNCGIDVSSLIESNVCNTTLAFVSLDGAGERNFTFYRNGCADVSLCESELPHDILKDCRIFHFGSVSLTNEPSRSATFAAAQLAKEAGALVSCDPNYRQFLWSDSSEAKEQMLRCMKYADILKVSKEEMLFLTGETDLVKGAATLQRLGPQIVLVTCGADGSYFHTPTCNGSVPAFAVTAIDTTGAGDAFFGALLYCLVGKTINDITAAQREDWRKMLDFANAAAGLSTQKKGAIPSMPSINEIQYCVNNVQRIRSGVMI